MARRPEVTLMVAMEGQLALELATEQRPDLILLDLHLPDISGEEVLRRLRADPRTEDTPVVVLSADAASTRPAQLRSMGASDYMTKPLDIARLLAIVDEIEATPRDAHATPRGVPTMARDGGSGSDVRLAEAPAVAAMTASEFVHDIHNLLGVILNYCTLLGRDLSDPGSEADLREIQTAAEGAVGLVREMFLSDRSDSRNTTQ
jgi:CheY-like chemotaxis protein